MPLGYLSHLGTDCQHAFPVPVNCCAAAAAGATAARRLGQSSEAQLAGSRATRPLKPPLNRGPAPGLAKIRQVLSAVLQQVPHVC